MKKWTTLADKFVRAKQARKDRKTVDWYAARLKHWLDFVGDQKLKVKQVQVDDLDVFFGQLKADGFAYTTRAGTATALRGFFKWLKKRGHIKENPFLEFEPLERERVEKAVIRLDYAYRMIKTAESNGSAYGIRDAAIMRLLLQTGARREEITTLRLEWVDLETGQIKIKGKYSHERPAFLTLTTITALRRWLDIRPGQDAALFVGLHPSRAGIYQALRPGAVNDLLTRWARRAELPAETPVNPHAWRRRFATEMAKSQDPFRLGFLMGHTDISVTQMYVQNQPDVLRDLVRKFAPDPDDQT
ncbi:MAG: tyrosine-type recombinase/integrase [Chloroflexi bacterium]|nr:tyrosine-type recombinase/integrase [Chloroflexota bacterium]